MGGMTLSIAPHPNDQRAVALLLTREGEHTVMAVFESSLHAEDVLDFLDGAFRVSAQANQALVQQLEARDG